MPAFTLHFADVPGGFPMYGTNDGKRAVPLFKTRESAQRFSDTVPHQDRWEVREQPSADHLADWLRDVMTSNGVTEVALEPNPASMNALDSTAVIPIAAYVIELEMSRDPPSNETSQPDDHNDP